MHSINVKNLALIIWNNVMIHFVKKKIYQLINSHVNTIFLILIMHNNK